VFFEEPNPPHGIILYLATTKNMIFRAIEDFQTELMVSAVFGEGNIL